MGADVAIVTSEQKTSHFYLPVELSKTGILSSDEPPRKSLLDFFSGAHHASFQGSRPEQAGTEPSEEWSDESTFFKSLGAKAQSRRLPTSVSNDPHTPIQRGPFLRRPPDIFVAEETTVPTTSPTTEATALPSELPTVSPSTSLPTMSPAAHPSTPPSTAQDIPAPSSPPTPGPTPGPTAGPTPGPTLGPTQRPTAAPTPGPTPGETPRPSASPTMTEPPSLPPTPGPTPGPSAGPTPGPTPGPTHILTSPPGTTCPNDATLVDEIAAHQLSFESNPITVLAQHEENVTFAVGQTWSDDLLCLISTHLESTSGTFTCPSAANVGPGDFAEYTAVCHGGYALVELFVYEANLTTSDSPAIPPICEQTEAAYTHKYEFQIPCQMMQQGLDCPVSEAYTCDEMVTVLSTEDFTTASQVDSWLFGKSDEGTEDPHLVLDAENTEISKIYAVPLDAKTLLFQFELLEIQSQSPHVVLVRVQNYYLNVTAALDQDAAAWDFAGGISVSIQRTDPTRVQVSTAIPAPLYLPNGRLSLGVRSASEAAVGFDNVRLSAVCGAV
jgi:hypothetical protein